MNTRRIGCVACLIFLLVCAVSHGREGISVLMDVGESQKHMQRELDKESAAFDRILKAINTGGLVTGTDKGTVALDYGDPVITMPEADGTEQWVYKPAGASWFSNDKIYLIFGPDGLLERINVLPGVIQNENND
ncbi:MAG: hypothetical protein ABH885_06825 [Candidatus Omnitrophota bacterium]